MGISWQEVVAHALTLADAVEDSHYDGQAVKVASNGRAFISPGREADSFCLLMDLDMVEMLKETHPKTYYQTPHYVGWPGVLVRYTTKDPDRVRSMIALARDQAAASAVSKPRRKK